MSARDTLIRLAQGQRPGDRLLGACRLQWAGAEAFGEEAVLELFRAAPLDLAEAQAVETATGAALVGEEAALVADVYDGRIGRLWRVGAGDAPEAEPFVAVAFDPDLRQERGHVYLRGEDYPELPVAAHEAVLAAGHALIDVPGAHRARAFAVRAFGDSERTTALFAVHQLSGGRVRQAGFHHAVALIDPQGTRHVRDPHRPRDWTPRL